MTLFQRGSYGRLLAAILLVPVVPELARSRAMSVVFALTLAWSLLSAPDGSSASVRPAEDSASASIVTDRRGLYLVQLAANDGALEAEPVVFVIESLNTPPVADAGSDLDVFVGEIGYSFKT